MSDYRPQTQPAGTAPDPWRRRGAGPIAQFMRGLLTAVVLGLCAQPAAAALDAVSGRPDPAVDSVPPAPAGDPAQVAVSLANGFPLWYRDGNGTKLTLCLDTTAEVAPGVTVNPCDFFPPSAGAPPSFPNNFGAEALYWSAAATGTYSSSTGGSYSVLLALGLEAGFAALGPIADGNQAVFSRIRVRFDVPVAGTYRVTHPFGSRDYVVTTPGVAAVRQTQDLGVDAARDFLVAMADRAAPAEPVPFVPAIDAGIVNTTGATIGPFLGPTAPFDPVTLTGGPVTATGGATYLGLPFSPALANVAQPVSGGIDGVGYLDITLLDPPAGFLLDAGGVDGTPDNSVRLASFQVIGKRFDDGPNLPPGVESVVTAGTDNDTPVNIEVFPNGIAALDPVSASNRHGIDPQALALVHPQTGALVLTQTLATAGNGLVRRLTNTATGRSVFRYTPPPGFTGTDSFQYVVQDKGGLISAPGTVLVTVEELQLHQADYRGRSGEWFVTGSSSDSTNAIELFAAPRAILSGAAQVPPAASAAAGKVGLRLSDNLIDYTLKIDPLPAGAINAVQIQAGAPGTNGPILFYLFDRGVEGDFTGSKEGSLTLFNLLARPEVGISTFADAVRAIRAGTAYVNVRTDLYPGGELRGQIEQPSIGTVPVQPDGRWSFSGKARVSPGALPGVGVRSANGIRLADELLRRR